MSSAAFSKSKAFKEKEQKVKESLRRATKQDLVADLSRYTTRRPTSTSVEFIFFRLIWRDRFTLIDLEKHLADEWEF